MKSILFQGAMIVVATFTPIKLSYALPTLDGNKFFAPSSLFNSSGWSYTGTLPASLNAGFKAKNIDDPVTVCIPYIGCSNFGGDQQYSTGSRKVTSTVDNTPSYSLTFRGEFGTKTFEAWEDSLLDQSYGQKFNSDVDQVQFPAPGSGITNEHPIPDEWQSLTGYKNPAGSYAKFNNTYSLSRSYLNAGESGCPQGAGHCKYTESFFKGGANLQANMEGSGSIENSVAGTQSVNINAKANRITTFKVNDDAVYSGTINGSASTFSLEEEKVKSVDFSFTGDFKNKTISVGADVEWDGRGETANFDASYVQRVEMSDFLNVGSDNQFVVEVRDDPQLTAGIEGTDFFKAKVLASTGLSAIDTVFKPVFEPVDSGRLSVQEAKVANESHLLKIPNNGFVNDHEFRFYFKIINDGSMDISVDSIALKVFEEDPYPLPDDQLLSGNLYNLEEGALNLNLGLLLSPGEIFNYAVITEITAERLNNARKFEIENGYLELAATGEFSFTDIFGTRSTGEFDVKFVPEPSTLTLILLGLFLTLTINNKGFQSRFCWV